ncbi:MAG: pirin family protein [Bacteroidales bacterium]|nr:pirin family protein [Bacteroidales bacterium]
MKRVIHRASERGHADHGWLNTWHSFSFANYYDPGKISFGKLRVLNDDTVAPGKGFGMHAHDNMEIVTIPLSGALEHKDSMGNSGVIKAGEIQVMSAGSGIYHSEFNHSKEEEVSLLQIWVIPDRRDVGPRYDQFTYDKSKTLNNLYQVISPEKSGEGSWIHQQSWFSLGELDRDMVIRYSLKKKGNGIYLFVIEGMIETCDVILEKRDALGIIEAEGIEIKALDQSNILLIEVPIT